MEPTAGPRLQSLDMVHFRNHGNSVVMIRMPWSGDNVMSHEHGAHIDNGE